MADNERLTTGAETNTDPVNDECKKPVSDGDNAVKTDGVNGPDSGDKTISVNGKNADGKEVKGSAIGYKNLVPLNERAKAEQRAIQIKGGKARAEQQRQRKTAKEIAQAILSANMTDDQISEVLDGAKSLIGDDKSAYAVLIAKMIQEGLTGNVNAFTAIRDTAGDKPTDKAEVTAAITPADMALVEKVRRRLESEEVTE